MVFFLFLLVASLFIDSYLKMVIFFFFLVAFLVSGQANKEEFHKETTNSSINCNERTESSNHLKPPDIVSDQTNKEFHKETTNPSKSPDCETIYDSVSDNFQDNKEEFHNEATNLSKLLDHETVYDSISDQANKEEFHNETTNLSISCNERAEYSNQLKPPGCETKYDLDIKHSELTDLKVFESGGFGIVYKGQWNGLCIAAKVVKRGNYYSFIDNQIKFISPTTSLSIITSLKTTETTPKTR